MLYANAPIINDANAHEYTQDLVIDGERKTRGLMPRDFRVHPQGCFSYATPFPNDELIDEAEWPERLKEQQANKSSLADLREQNYQFLKSLNQNGLGLCWAFSTTKAAMYDIVKSGGTPKILSAWWVAGRVKGWRDQGGWGAESLKEIVTDGVPEMSLCPSYKSSFDNQATRTNAAQNRITEWFDGSNNRDLARKQMISSLLKSQPCVLDYNWWSHSVCGIFIASLKPLRIGIDNSWGESAGEKGIYMLEESKAVPDGLVIPRVGMAA